MLITHKLFVYNLHIPIYPHPQTEDICVAIQINVCILRYYYSTLLRNYRGKTYAAEAPFMRFAQRW